MLALMGVACAREDKLPEAAGAFYTGVAALQVGETGVAEAALRRVTDLAPTEPAAWADLALVGLQRRELDQAAERVGRALALAPDDSRIAVVAAVIARERGRLDTAAQHLRRAVELDPRNVKALYLLAQVVEQEGRPGNVAEARRLVEAILSLEPDNLVALIERARLAAAERDGQALRQALDRVAERVAARGRGADLTADLRAVRTSAAAADFQRAATAIAFLQTALRPLPAYLDDEGAVVTSPGGTDLLLARFVRLQAPAPRAAPPDTGLRFEPESLTVGEGASGTVAWLRTVWLSDQVPLALVAASGDTVWISSDPARPEPHSFRGGAATVAPLDYDYDFRMDLALAGRGGLRLLRQDDGGSFTDATATAIPPAAARRAYLGAWAADLDMEGDVDLVLGAADGPPVVLRNRGDGRFDLQGGRAFEGVTRLRDFAWADWDGDGDPDAVLLDADGRLHLFANQRSRTPQFVSRPPPDTLGAVRAIGGGGAAADWNDDATLDVIVLRADGSVIRLSAAGDAWDVAALARWPEFPAAGTARLLVADLDNNGDPDLVASTPTGTRVWLSTAPGRPPDLSLDLPVSDVADLSGEGRLDLFGVADDGTPRWLANQGTMDYYSTTIRPRAAGATGDRRINSFGIGGEVEVRAGLLYQKREIHGPAVHFGLGENPAVAVARIIWPNGTVQAEFNLPATNESIFAMQRLKGSCPWVFTSDGRAMRFVTDFLWRTALGLRINAQGGAAVIHSEDWIRIRGDQLAPRDGFYDVRITAELWETHFFDHVALLVVDHPAGTEAFADERFTLPAPTPAVHLTGPLHPVAGARDHRGRDVMALVRETDGRYVDGFALGPYQGVAEEHYVEVALGDDVPDRGPLWLVAAGWVYPTDASINVATTQGDHPRPHGVRVEVPDGRGGGAWHTVAPDFGFPAGKTKTMLIPLEHAFRPGAPRRVRLSTNMEVYWDRIAWAVGRPDASFTAQRLLPATAELRYRGFSAVTQTGRRAPELPSYGEVESVVPRWRDLEGYYTRYGDVRPLNEAVDDRYVIMNAGDELAFRFPAPAPPPPGWTRDFVLIGDGWVKDGDYNTGFSATVLPLPYHGLTDYGRAPGRLEDDPAFRLHPEDWKTFHTRYVTPRSFQRALVAR